MALCAIDFTFMSMRMKPDPVSFIAQHLLSEGCITNGIISTA